MKHLDSGELRRMIDEPQAFGDQERLHAQTCAECRARGALIASDAAYAAQAFAGEISVDVRAGYTRLRERLSPPSRAVRWYPAASAAALAAAFALALVFSPLGGYARSFLTIFEPEQFQPIEVSRADLRQLRLAPEANHIGTQRVIDKPKRTEYPTLASAQKHTSIHVLAPSALPAHFGTVHSFFVTSPAEMTFTFSAAKARAFERRSHKTLPPMPQGLDGTTVRLQTGRIFNAHYEAAHAKGSGRPPFFELVEAPVPRVTSTGASLEILERYLLSMPNVSPKLAEQIRALGDIQNTVPVPVEIDKQRARRVTVQGAQGLAVGDNTGLGAGVMWQKNGIIYAVAGPISMDDVLTVANGLR